MKLYENWRTIVRRAWSIRFALLAGVLSGVEVGLPFFAAEFPHGVFAGLSAAAACAAFVARIVAQQDV